MILAQLHHFSTNHDHNQRLRQVISEDSSFSKRYLELCLANEKFKPCALTRQREERRPITLYCNINIHSFPLIDELVPGIFAIVNFQHLWSGHSSLSIWSTLSRSLFKRTLEVRDNTCGVVIFRTSRPNTRRSSTAMEFKSPIVAESIIIGDI